MKCMHCGYEFNEGVFCPECGARNDLEKINESGKGNAEQDIQSPNQVIEQKESKRAGFNVESYSGAFSENGDEIKKAREENDSIDILKEKLMSTKSQTKRREILGGFIEDIQTSGANKRLEMLRFKVNQDIPKSVLCCRVYGITIIIAFVVALILYMLDLSDGSLLSGIMLWASFGIYIWPVWKIVLLVKRKSKHHYLNIKDI